MTILGAREHERERDLAQTRGHNRHASHVEQGLLLLGLHVDLEEQLGACAVQVHGQVDHVGLSGVDNGATAAAAARRSTPSDDGEREVVGDVCGEYELVVGTSGALEREAGQAEAELVEAHVVHARGVLVHADVEHELLERERVRLRHVLTRGGDVGLGRKEAAQPHHARLERLDALFGELARDARHLLDALGKVAHPGRDEQLLGQRVEAAPRGRYAALGQVLDELTMMVGLLLARLADGQHVEQVAAHHVQEADVRVALALEEAEQRVLDVLARALQRTQLLTIFAYFCYE